MWYFEQLSLGRWSPATMPERPVVETISGKTRLRRSDGVGPQVRNVREVLPFLSGLTLSELQQVYAGQDGVSSRSAP